MNGKIRILFVISCVCLITSCSTLSTMHPTQFHVQSIAPCENALLDSVLWDSTRSYKNTESLGSLIKHVKSIPWCLQISNHKRFEKQNFSLKREESIQTEKDREDAIRTCLQLPLMHRQASSCRHHLQLNRLRPMHIHIEQDLEVFL